MFNICMFVTGPTAGGKTTLVDSLGRRGWASLHTGDMLRAHNVYAGASESAVAPASADALVDGWVDSLLVDVRNSGVPNMVVMESCPRKKEQLKYCKLAHDRGYHPIILYMYAEPTVRWDRMHGRDVFFDPKRLEVDRRKFEEEISSNPWGFLSVSSVDCRPSGDAILTDGMLVPVYGVDTTVKNVCSCDLPFGVVDGTAVLMSTCVNYYNKLRAGRWNTIKQVDTKSMVHKCIGELSEVVDALNCEDRMSIREELIDSLWYLFMAMVGNGMGALDVVSEFMRKYDINCTRAMTGTKPHSNLV